MSVDRLEPNIMRSILGGRSVTIAAVMKRHKVSMREAYGALVSLQREGCLARSGGRRGEPFRWTAPQRIER